MTPLKHVGRDRIRQVCQDKLNAGTGAVGWDVPDLTVVVDGDLAEAWGFNRVRTGDPGDRPIET